VDWLFKFIFSYTQSFIHNQQNGSDDVTAFNLMQLYTENNNIPNILKSDRMLQCRNMNLCVLSVAASLRNVPQTQSHSLKKCVVL